MSDFIVPVGSLPTISSIGDTQTKQNAQNVAGNNLPFANILSDAIQNLQGTSETSQTNMYSLAVGGSDDMHTGAIDAVKNGVAVSYASGLTSAAIRAYNELMRMQV